jgi:hypothetical protein
MILTNTRFRRRPSNSPFVPLTPGTIVDLERTLRNYTEWEKCVEWRQAAVQRGVQGRRAFSAVPCNSHVTRNYFPSWSVCIFRIPQNLELLHGSFCNVLVFAKMSLQTFDKMSLFYLVIGVIFML